MAPWGGLSDAQVRDMIAEQVGTNKVKLPAAAVADYAAFASASASSGAVDATRIDDIMNADDNASTIELYAGAATRTGNKLGASSALIGKVVRSVSVKLSISGAPTGIVSVVVRDSGDVVKATVGTIDVATIAGVKTWYDFAYAAGVTLASGDKILIEYSGGNAANKLLTWVNSGNPFDANNTLNTQYTGVYTDNAGIDSAMKLGTRIVPASNAVDSNTGTYWESASEANPNIYGDASASKLISGLRVWWEATGRPTNYTIDASTDAATWTTVKSETTQPTAAAYKEYAFNTVLARYIRVRSTDAGSNVMRIYEMQYYVKTTDQALATHGHGSVS